MDSKDNQCTSTNIPLVRDHEVSKCKPTSLCRNKWFMWHPKQWVENSQGECKQANIQVSKSAHEKVHLYESGLINSEPKFVLRSNFVNLALQLGCYAPNGFLPAPTTVKTDGFKKGGCFAFSIRSS